MKHVVLITTSYPQPASEAMPGSEAAGLFVRELCQYLSRSFEVIVLAPGNDAATYRDGAVTVRTYWAPPVPLVSLQMTRLNDLTAILRVLVSGYRTVRRLAEELSERPLILAMWALPSGAWAMHLAARMKAPYAVWALGSDIWRLSKVPLVRSVLIHVLRRSSMNFADGRLLADEVRRISRKQCEYLPSARATRDIAPRERPHRPYVLGFLGRWHENKGVDLLLEALGRLDREDWKHIKCVKIAGGGELQQMVEDRARSLQEGGAPVQLLGYLDQDAASAFLSSTDILLIPSRKESVPLVLTDGVRHRCAVVATPVGDIPMLNERYRFGLVADEVTSGAFAVTLRTIVRQDLDVYRERAEEMSEVFSIERSASRLLCLVAQEERPEGQDRGRP